MSYYSQHFWMEKKDVETKTKKISGLNLVKQG